MRNYLLLFALFFTVGTTLAQDAKKDSVPPKPKTFWSDTKAEFQFGYSNYSGNTEKQDMVYGAKLGKKWAKNSLSISATGTYGEVNNERNQENYTIGLFDEVKFSKKLGGYVKYGFLKDEIAGYTAVHKIGSGALLTFVDKKEVSFKARLGYEYRFEDRVVDEDAVTMNTGKAGFRFNFLLMKDVEIKTEVNYQHDFEKEENYFADGFAKAVFDVNKNIDIEILYSVEYRNDPPVKTPGDAETGVAPVYFQKTDKTFRTTLKIKF